MYTACGQGAGVLVLAPSLTSLARRVALLERLLLLATGALQLDPAPSRSVSEAAGMHPHSSDLHTPTSISKMCFPADMSSRIELSILRAPSKAANTGFEALATAIFKVRGSLARA